MNYFQTLPTQTKEYFKILSKEVPEFLEEYIETPEMKKLDGVNQICGGYWRKENIFEMTAVRRLGLLDNHVKVADLIYQTDPYIFPYFFQRRLYL